VIKKSVHTNGGDDKTMTEVLKYQPGDLVEVLTDRTSSNDGLTVATACRDGIHLYTKIDLKSYPSCNDFFQPSVECLRKQTASVVKFIGRPQNIKSDQRLWEYDVYEILVNGFSAQAFAANLKLIKNAHGAN
jgi:hypothetical protein